MSIPCTYLNCEDTFECRNLLRAHIGIHKASTNGEYNFTCIYIYIYTYSFQYYVITVFKFMFYPLLVDVWLKFEKAEM